HAAVVGAASDGSVMIDGLNGPTTHNYITSTEAILQGTPGEQITLAPGGFFTPNALPVMHLAMNGIDTIGGGQTVPGELGSIGATIVGNVSLDSTTAFTLPGQSLRFEGGHLIISPDSELDIADNLFVNLRFRLSSGAGGEKLLIRKGDGVTEAWSLRVDGNGYLVAQVITDSGSYTVQSTQFVESDRWYIAGLRVRANGLELGLNEERVTTAITGAIVGSGSAIAVGGTGFLGYIDDVKLGHETSSNALMTFGDGSLSTTVTFGVDGTARVPVQATGRQVGRGQVVGLSEVGAGGGITQEGQRAWYADIVVNTFSTLLGIKTAYADPTAGAQEAGLAIAREADWGWVAEWVGERLFNDAWDDVKQVSEFIYQLTAVSDIVTLLDAVYNLAKGDTDQIDGFEVTFAAIGIGATAIAVMTSGGTALPAFRGGLTAIKPVLRELFNTGAREALQVGVITSKYLFRQIKTFVRNPGAALDEMADFGSRLTNVVLDTSGDTLRYLFRTVRNPSDMVDWVRNYRLRGICLGYQYRADGELYALVGNQGEFLAEKPLTSVIRSTLAGALFGRMANADPIDCVGFSVNQKLIELANDTARFGSAAKAGEISKSLGKIVKSLNDAGIVLNTQRSMDVLADIAHTQGSALAEMFARNAAKGFATKNGYYALNIQNGALDTLLDSIGNVSRDVPGYQEWIRKIGVEHSFAIKGIAGEAQATAKVTEKYAGRSPVLTKLSDRIDKPFENIDGKIVKGNVEGVDAVFELGDGTKVFVESKVLTNATSATEAAVLKRLEKQFFKHLETKVLPLVESGDDLGQYVFKSDKVPILDYHLAGSWFTPDRLQKIVERFNETLKDPRLRQIVKAEPKFEFTASNIIPGDLLPSIIN
ncbi:MAG: hypothetical protein ABW176_20305, partial [Candidatus Thiodiazotropha endolucinida]